MNNKRIRQIIGRNYVRYSFMIGLLCLLFNQVYEHYLVERSDRRQSYLVQTAVDNGYAQMASLCKQWTESGSDDSYLDRLWSMVVPEQWHRSEMSLFLFKDSSMVYWANQMYDGNIDSTLLCKQTSSIDTIDGNLALVFRFGDQRSSKLAITVLHIQNLATGALNPYVFKDKTVRIHTKIPASESAIEHEKVEVAGVTFYFEPSPEATIPIGIALLGWCGVFLIVVSIERYILHRTRKNNTLVCLLSLVLSLVAIRLLVSYFNIPNQYGSAFDNIIIKGDEILPLSMGNLLVTFLFGLVFVIYLFRVRRKHQYGYNRLSRKGQYVSMVVTMALINIMVAYYHYALVGIIYNTNISYQVYDMFEMSGATVMFMVTAGIVISIRIITNRISTTCFSNFNMAFCILVSVLLLALILIPIESQIRNTGYILLAFHLVFLVISYVWRRWISEYYVILQTLAVFALYLTMFSTIEFNVVGQKKVIEYSHRLQVANMNIPQPEIEKYIDCNYAIINGDGLLLQGGNLFDIQKLLPYINSKADTLIKVDNYSHYIRHADNKATYIVSHKTASVFDFLALFSYIYILSFVVVMLIFYGSGVGSDMMIGWSKVALRIRLSVMAIVFISLVTLALVVTNQSRENQITQNRININNTMQNVLSGFRGYLAINSECEKPLESWYKDVVSSAYTMVNVYDLSGRSLNREHGKYLDRISNEAFQNLNWRDAPYYHQTVHTAYDVEYISAYTTVWVDGVKYGYLNIMDNDPLRIEGQRAMMADLLNIFIVILLAVLMLSLPVYHHITRPLYRISYGMKNIAKMKKITPNAKASPNDEVEILIAQYNKMIDYLEQSYRCLAENEREIAWREMARQVAHEIKNPLTPMKLKVQMLQRAIEKGDPDIESKTKATLDILLEQIELLSRIASAFSDFSKMDEGNPAPCNLAAILKGTYQLFSKLDKGIEFTIDVPQEPVVVVADASQLSRVFVNLCKNSIEAIKAKNTQSGVVSLQLRVNEQNMAVVTISDDGVGVSVEQKSRMFMPNFTTKSSGSGLGLAISAQIIKGISGEISFDSQPCEGAVFTVEIPLSDAAVEFLPLKRD